MMNLRKITPYIFSFFVATGVIAFPLFLKGKATNKKATTEVSINSFSEEERTTFLSQQIFDSMHLVEKGLSFDAFYTAFKGYTTMKNKGLLKNTNIITICDFGQTSSNKRMYIIDVNKMELVLNTYVAHGRKSGQAEATSFSNVPESHQSSLGFYVTSFTYQGGHGLSLRLNGMEKSLNDKALARNVVVHGAEYATEKFIKMNGYLGRSFGCPAVPQELHQQVISTIKDGTCLFIYHPKQYTYNESRLVG